MKTVSSDPKPDPDCAPAAGAPAAPPLRPLPWPLRAALIVFACASLATGIVGIFVPGLPTTVFVLMAAWAAARSSPRLYGWLLHHRVFGPIIHNWHQGGFVSRKAKWSASVAMLASALIAGWTIPRTWVAALAIGCMACICLWLWRRPEPPPGS
ncbi:MAG: YbaN family protein [Comamonas sp.]